MSVRIRNILENIKYTERNIDLDITKPFSDNIESLKKELQLENPTKASFVICLKNKERIVINDYSKSLKSHGFTPEEDSLNIEPAIKGNLSTYILGSIAYSGPIIVFLLFILFNKNNLNLIQILATGLTTIHYLKRIYEVNYVHEFAMGSVSLVNTGVLGVVFYYWVLFGVCTSYFIFRNDMSNALFSTPVLMILAVLMLAFEYGNYDAHYRLKLLKDANKGKRGIPRGGLFEYVSCPHYFFELCSWFCFSLIVNTVTGYLFVLYSLIAMGAWARDKQKYYREYFKEQYPENRKAMIPFVF
jgi:very-long-chain enoyl-CoA reductase